MLLLASIVLCCTSFTSATAGWKRVRQPKDTTQVSVGSDGRVLFLNKNNEVRGWTYVGRGQSRWLWSASFKQISVGSANHIWGVNPSNQVFRWTACGWKQVPGGLKQVSVGSDGTVWGVNKHNRIWRESSSSKDDRKEKLEKKRKEKIRA